MDYNKTTEWKEIEAYDGTYEVSNTGMVRSRNRFIVTGTGSTRYLSGQMIKFKVSRDSYRFVSLSFRGKVKSHYLHRLVAAAFIPNPLNKPTVNHINGRKSDNRVANLEWVTLSENMRHAYETGLCSTGGATHPKARRVVDTVSGIIYPTIKVAAEALGYKYHTLRNMLAGYNPNRSTLMYK